jgi:hypothetical protein
MIVNMQGRIRRALKLLGMVLFYMLVPWEADWRDDGRTFRSKGGFK